MKKTAYLLVALCALTPAVTHAQTSTGMKAASELAAERDANTDTGPTVNGQLQAQQQPSTTPYIPPSSIVTAEAETVTTEGMPAVESETNMTATTSSETTQSTTGVTAETAVTAEPPLEPETNKPGWKQYYEEKKTNKIEEMKMEPLAEEQRRQIRLEGDVQERIEEKRNERPSGGTIYTR